MFRVVVCVVSSFVGAIACAQTLPWKVVVPTSAQATEGPIAAPLPFGSSVARRVMYAYDGSLVGFTAPLHIGAIALRCDGATPGASSAGTYNFSLDLSTSRHPVGALETTFNNNHGHDRLRVRTGALSVSAPAVGAMPNAFSLRIPFAVPFDWDPRNGPLLLDFAYSAASPAFAAWDATNGGVAGLAANGSSASLASSSLTIAPVVELELAADVVPASLATAEASTATTFPWGRPAGAQMRTLTIYDASLMAFSRRRRITGLAWRTDVGSAMPARTYTVRISLSTGATTAATVSGTFDANHGADRTVVFDGVIDAPARPAGADLGDFDLLVPLQRSFEYDPANGPLVVDLQLFGCTGAMTADFDCTNATVGVARTSNTVSATSAVATTTQQQIGLVMALQTVAVPTAPQVLANASTLTPNSTSFPFGGTNTRTLLLVSAAEAGITEPFVVRHLRFRPSNGVLSGGPATFTLTIDLSHAATTPTTINTTFDTTHCADRERVFDGEMSIPFFTRAAADPGFPIQVKLQQPFVWSPQTSPYLAIDVRVLARVGPGTLIETTGSLNIDDARLTANTANSTVGTAQSLAPTVRLGGEGQNGLAVDEGTGCIGLNGAPFTATIGLPTLPNPDLQVRVGNAAGNAAAFFIIGFAPLNVPLPGTNNCLVLHAGEIGIVGAAITGPTGDGVLPLPLPGAPQFDGFEFRGQWWILDPTANALGIVTTDAQHYTARFF